MADQNEYLTVAEARALLQVSEWKMTDLLKRGELPSRKNPRNRREKLIKRTDVDAWLADAPAPKQEQGAALAGAGARNG